MTTYNIINGISKLSLHQMETATAFPLKKAPLGDSFDFSNSTVNTDKVPDNLIYKLSASKGSEINFIAISYFDPDLIVFDSNGNPILKNSELDDYLAQIYLGSELPGYKIDIEMSFNALYTGDYYIKPGFLQGSATQNKAWSFTVQEKIDKISMASSDTVYVFKSEKTGPSIAPKSDSYFYTTNEEEASFIRSKEEWPFVEKKATFEAAHSQLELSVPVHRFYSEKNQSHFFTINEDERSQIIEWSSTGKNGYDWKYEGEGFKVYTDSMPKDILEKSAIPVYRMFIKDKDFDASNGEASGHYFTADKFEYDTMIKLTGVNGEGIAFYGEVLGA